MSSYFHVSLKIPSPRFANFHLDRNWIWYSKKRYTTWENFANSRRGKTNLSRCMLGIRKFLLTRNTNGWSGKVHENESSSVFAEQTSQTRKHIGSVVYRSCVVVENNTCGNSCGKKVYQNETRKFQGLNLSAAIWPQNMARTVCNGLSRWPIKSVTIWMGSRLALFWLNNPRKNWKVFVADRVKKTPEITNEIIIVWKYWPAKMHLADLGIGGGLPLINSKIRSGLQDKSGYLVKTSGLNKPNVRTGKLIASRKSLNQLLREWARDEWILNYLLDQNSYWRTWRVTAWIWNKKSQFTT